MVLDRAGLVIAPSAVLLGPVPNIRVHKETFLCLLHKQCTLDSQLSVHGWLDYRSGLCFFLLVVRDSTIFPWGVQ